MCLVCLAQTPNSPILTRSDMDAALAAPSGARLECWRHKSVAHMPDGSVIALTPEAVDEILHNAMAVVHTGIDLSFDVWGIQWKRGYTPDEVARCMLVGPT